MGLFKQRQRNVKKTGLARSMKKHKKILKKLEKEKREQDQDMAEDEQQEASDGEVGMEAEEAPQKQKPIVRGDKLRRNATPLVKNASSKASHSNTVHAQHMSKKKMNKLAKAKRRAQTMKLAAEMAMS